MTKKLHILENILHKNEYPPTFCNISLHKPNTLTQKKNTRKDKDKWALVTSYGSQTRITANFFNNIYIKITYKTNTTENRLKKSLNQRVNTVTVKSPKWSAPTATNCM
jgi:hypothetical protein